MRKSICIVTTLVVMLLACTGNAHAQTTDLERGKLLPGVTFKLEQMRDAAISDIQRYEGEIHKSNATIEKCENIIRLARKKGNAEAERIAGSALAKARQAKLKNEKLRHSAELRKKRVEGVLADVKTGGKNPEAKAEQAEFENMNADWMEKQKRLIALRESNPYIPAIYKSLKTKAPPSLPPTKYDDLQPGDVLLISPEDTSFWDQFGKSSFWINVGDKVSSISKSPASHTVLYLKEVNGKKLFLDHTPGRGSHVISEAEFLRTYGQRDALVASARVAVAQPVKEAETAKIWEFTKKLAKKEGNILTKKGGNIIDQTGYGLYGNDNMVCSEASRWVLVKSGREIPETDSPAKRLLGIHYGPANFFSDEYNFIITPLWAPTEKK